MNSSHILSSYYIYNWGGYSHFKCQIVQKTFVGVGEGEGKKVPNQVAGEILSFFTRTNFVVADRGETIT